jgi:hypothetical protein
MSTFSCEYPRFLAVLTELMFVRMEILTRLSCVAGMDDELAPRDGMSPERLVRGRGTQGLSGSPCLSRPVAACAAEVSLLLGNCRADFALRSRRPPDTGSERIAPGSTSPSRIAATIGDPVTDRP